MGERLTLYGTLALALQDAQIHALNNSVERYLQMLSTDERSSPNLSFLNTSVEVRL